MTSFPFCLASSPPVLTADRRGRRITPNSVRALHPVPVMADQVQICADPYQPVRKVLFVFRSRVQFRQEPTRGFFHRFRQALLLLSAHGAEHATKDVFNERHKFYQIW